MVECDLWPSDFNQRSRHPMFLVYISSMEIAPTHPDGNLSTPCSQVDAHFCHLQPPNLIATMVSTVELMDRFQILLEQENTTYQFKNYLSPSHQLDCFHSGSSKTCTDREARQLSDQKTHWRSKLCAWMYHIVDLHSLDRELVEISMSYMDRYLAERPTHDAQGFQLAGMTCLYLGASPPAYNLLKSLTHTRNLTHCNNHTCQP